MNNVSAVFLNTISSVALKLVTIVSSFILPRLMIATYGSEVNGLVASITEYLGLITFLDLGVGAVVQSSLYKALVKKDQKIISSILVSANKFFNKIGYVLILYIIILTVSFSYITNSNYDLFYTGMLVFSISISLFAQYFFGIVSILLLNADQKAYVANNVQSFILIVNTIACVILINNNYDVCFVKLASSMVFLIRPIFLKWYVKKNYKIDSNVVYDNEPINQKWNGLAQHVLSVLITSVPILILSIFCSMSIVSIYSLYYLVVGGIQSFLSSYYEALKPYIGKIIAEGDQRRLYVEYKKMSWNLNTVSTLLYSITSVLIIPFISVYMNNITDTNYLLPDFAIVYTFSFALFSFRMPYNVIILGARHFKQTQNSYIIAVCLDILISCYGVYFFGINGVAYGLFVSMLFQLFWFAKYSCKIIENNDVRWEFKQFGVNVVTFFSIYLLTSSLEMSHCSYYLWILLAIKTSIIGVITSLFINNIFYKENVNEIIQTINRNIVRMRFINKK